jgi:HemY protein
MLRALWFLIKVSVMVAGALWLLERPGEITLSALGYTITVQTGLFLLALLAALIVLYFVFRAVSAVFSLPSDVGGYWARRRREKGWRDVTRGFVSVAAGDARQADMFARRAQKALPEANGMALLLLAQTARLNGREDEARTAFESLMKDKDTAYLGLRGLMHSAVAAKDAPRALSYARQALTLFPKQDQILKTAYDLEIKNRHWDEALVLLKRAEKTRAMTADAVRSDRVALYVIQADEKKEAGDDRGYAALIEKAHKNDPFFVPVITRMAAIYKKDGKDRKIQGLVEKAFPVSPHPDLVTLWDDIVPLAEGQKDPMRVMRWYEKLISLNTDTDLSYLAAARAAIRENLLGEARAHLKHAEKIQVSSALYRLKALVEEKAGSDAAAIRALVERAADVPPSKTWVCRETGCVYPQWLPVALPHQSFNTIVWDYPGLRMAALPTGVTSNFMVDAA